MHDRPASPSSVRPAPFTYVAGTSALVLDSPHSGTAYPVDFGHACTLAALREAEDTHVDDLWSFAPRYGATLIAANFPRSYIDANRSLDEIDLELLDGPWAGPVNAASSKVKLGKGLVWRMLDDGTPIYAQRLSPMTVQSRIDDYWVPYHQAVARAIDTAYRHKGFVLHLNCHSMPARAAAFSTEYPGLLHEDFVLGDRDGTTATPELTRWIERFLNSRGYTVSVNHPYKGVELVRKHGQPGLRRHSIQIEINKRLYMNETTLQPNEGYTAMQSVLRELTEALLGWDGDADLASLKGA
jgi:N-formylglutamate deformylase